MGLLRDEPKRGSTAFAGERKEVSVGNQVVVLHGWPHEQKNQYILTGALFCTLWCCSISARSTCASLWLCRVQVP